MSKYQYNVTEARVMDDMSASFWLKRALAETLKRDIVDSLNDAKVLVYLLEARLAEIHAGIPAHKTFA